MPKIQIYSANAVMMANVFKYLPKSEAAVHTCSLKNLSEVFHIIHRKTPVQESLFDICMDYISSLFHFEPTILLL